MVTEEICIGDKTKTTLLGGGRGERGLDEKIREENLSNIPKKVFIAYRSMNT